MKCPYCGCEDSKVIDSRPTDEGERIRRRRECTKCGKRFTTYEIIETVPLIVVKKDGTRESFDRVKLFNGLLRACEKRPVPVETIEKAVTDIESSGKTQGHRRSRLCPLCVCLPSVQGRQHVRRRSHETAQREVNRQHKTKTVSGTFPKAVSFLFISGYPTGR